MSSTTTLISPISTVHPSMADHLDAHAKPPARLREIYKDFHKVKPSALDRHPNLIQFDHTGKIEDTRLKATDASSLPEDIAQVFIDFIGDTSLPTPAARMGDDTGNATVYEVSNVPGKQLGCLLLSSSL